MSDSSEEATENGLNVAALIIFVLLIVYIIVGGFIEKRKLPFGHETGVSIVVGLIVSLIFYLIKSEVQDFFLFNDTFFFYVCLPPIIFTSGFNMRRRKFFKNFGYIMMFGIFGTIITFIVFSALTYGIF